jgi:hypothetical protein
VNGPDKEKESAARTEDVRPRSPDDPAGESQPKRGSPVGRTVESIAAGEAVPSGDARAGSGANGGSRSVDL